MSVHDYDIANASGATVRADINAVLAAIASGNSNATAPGTTFPYLLWNDTTNGVKKRRNAANSTWLVESTIDETRVLTRSSNTILDVSDTGKTIIATAGYSQTFDAAATLGDGWNVRYIIDTGVVTFDPNGAEPIDGVASITGYPGDSFEIWCNGSVLKTVGRGVPSIFVGSFTRDLSLATGTQALTGLGFMPQEAEFFATAAGQPGATSWGLDIGGLAVVVYDDHVTTANTYNASTTNSILLETAIGSYQQASVQSFDADGLTLSWAKTGTPTGTATVVYRARRR